MGRINEKVEQINIFGETPDEELEHTLKDKFLIPPFSVFDAKQGYWQDRKRIWKSLGIKSEVGRNDNLLSFSKLMHEKFGAGIGTSIFDPVVCEVCYKWFNVDGGKIYDCFAGGSVRGIVAEKLGYKYYGIDLREEQIKANYENAQEVGVSPTWYCDDSTNVDKYIEDESMDLIFSCPPYYDLEVYSDKPNDLSNMKFDDFVIAYSTIIKNAVRKLKQDRFAIFVVGDIRDKDGFYRNFIDITKKAFNDAGCKTYNEIILLDASVGNASMRASGIFKSRKMTKVHQNILVFYKGNPKAIKDNFKDLDLDY